MKKITLSLAVAASAIVALSGCTSDADRAAENLSRSAEQFEVNRRIIAFNGITDKYILSVEGRCSVETAESALANALEITCKIGPDQYKKHFVGLSDNVSFFAEQLEAKDVSVYHYKVIFKPENIIPEVDLEGGEQ